MNEALITGSIVILVLSLGVGRLIGIYSSLRETIAKLEIRVEHLEKIVERKSR